MSGDIKASFLSIFVWKYLEMHFLNLINHKPFLNLSPEQMQCIWSVDLESQISMFGNQIFEKQFFFSVFFFLVCLNFF